MNDKINEIIKNNACKNQALFEIENFLLNTAVTETACKIIVDSYKKEFSIN